MPADIEILVPLRNPTAVFQDTLNSLLAQTARPFRVLLSDNHSTQGREVIDDAVLALTQAKIPVRLVRPPIELERVEHWNWMHFQSNAEWVKPLFTGDWLEPDYLAAVQREIERAPECRYVHSGYQFHDVAQGTKHPMISPWAGDFRAPKELQEAVLRFAMQFGPPSVATYRRDIFLVSGGYRTALPICADGLLYCTMAARFGATAIGRALSHFQLHGARFSTDLAGRQAATFSETMTYITMLVYRAWTDQVPLPGWGIARLYARQFRERLRQMFGESVA